jgi:hypothetical protein
MNNLFRITKDNVNNFLIEYSKNKQNNENNYKNKNKTKISKIIKEPKNDLNLNISKYLEKNDKNIEKNHNHTKLGKEQPIEVNFNYEKKENNQLNPNNKELKFNCEIKKTKIETETEIVDDNNKQKSIKKQYPNINSVNKTVDKQYLSEIKNNSNSNIDNNDKKKIMFEYGRSGIKMDRLKKSMKYNLNVLSSVDNMIKSFLDFNPKLKLNTILSNNQNDSDREKKIYWNSDGQIVIEKNYFFNVNINDKKDNPIYKKYNLIDFGYIKIYDITFTEEFINKHKIPSLNSIITFSENIKHFLKLIKLFEHTDQYKIKINQFGNSNLRDIFLQNLPSIILNINDKKNLFNSSDNKFTFYIKITQTKTIAFIIDKEEKIIFYLNSIEKNLSGYIFFYVVALDSKYKIINLNKLNLIQKNNVKIKKNKIYKNIKNKKQYVIKEKSSDISDFSDSNEFLKPQVLEV